MQHRNKQHHAKSNVKQFLLRSGQALIAVSTEMDIRRGGARTDNIVEGRNEAASVV